MKFKKVSALVRARVLFERICRNKNYVGCVVVVLLLLSFAFGYFVGDYIQHARFKKFVTTLKMYVAMRISLSSSILSSDLFLLQPLISVCLLI